MDFIETREVDQKTSYRTNSHQGAMITLKVFFFTKETSLLIPLNISLCVLNIIEQCMDAYKSDKTMNQSVLRYPDQPNAYDIKIGVDTDPLDKKKELKSFPLSKEIGELYLVESRDYEKNKGPFAGDTKTLFEIPTSKQNIASHGVGIENPSNKNIEASPAWDDQNRTSLDKPEELKNEEDDKNDVNLEDLKDVCYLSRSSHCHVKKMIHKPTGTPIALKIVDLDNEENYLKALKTEISTLQDCNSEYIIKCYGVYLTGGSISIALEYMDKGTLADILKEVGVICEPILGMITYQALKGMEYLHKNMKMIHREIKPSNILINSEGQVKIADSVVNNAIRSAIPFKFACHYRPVLPVYMSPERCRGEEFNFDSDLWSLGLTILECALGKCPYSEFESQKKLTFFDLIDIMSTKPTPSLPDTYSNSFRDFISICLRKEANSRTTATELLRHDFVKKYAPLKRDKFKGWLGTI